MHFNKNLNLLNKPNFVYDEKTKTLKKPEKGIMSDTNYSMLLLLYNETVKKFEQNKNIDKNVIKK